MHNRIRKTLLIAWAVLFLLCAADGYSQEQGARMLPAPVAQVLGIAFFAAAYGVLYLFWKNGSRAGVTWMAIYGIGALVVYLALLIAWLLLWKSPSGYQAAIVLFSVCTAPLASFSSMGLCILLWAGLFVLGLTLRKRMR